MKFFSKVCLTVLLLTGSACFAQTAGGVQSINGVGGGPFTFTGSGVSCSGFTCTFSGGGGNLPSGTTNQMLYYASNGTTVTALTLGTNLSISGGVLNASGSGSLPSGLVGQSLDNTNGSTTYSPSYANTFYQNPSVDLFGDSITYGTGATSLSLGYGNLILADLGNGTNYAVSGSLSGDMTVSVIANLSPVYSHNPAVTDMIGTNDTGDYGGNYGPYIANMTGLLTWAAVPRIAKIYATDSQCTQTGTWTNTAGFNFPGGLLISDTAGSTLTCTIVTQGPALYIGYTQDTSWTTGSMSVTVDGVSIGSNLSSTEGVSGITYAYQYPAFRYVVAPGTHTVVFTEIHSSGTSTDNVAPTWIGSAYPISTVSPPRVFQADIPPQENNANASLISTYNTQLLNLENNLIADGLPIQPVHESSGRPNNGGEWLLYYNVTTNPSDSDFQAATLPGGISCPASTVPGLHPNNCGHAHIRDAFEYYLKPIFYPVATGTSFGMIKPDGSSCTVTSGVLTCSGGSGGSPAFSAITSATNTTAAMVVGNGSTLNWTQGAVNAVFGPVITNTNNGTAAQAQIQFANGTSTGSLFKIGTGYSGFKSLNANDLGFYNSGGNLSILENVSSGNINFSVFSSTPQFVLTSSLLSSTVPVSIPALDQTAAGATGGTCAMVAGTSCTLTLGHTYTTPVCIVTQQSSTLTGGATGCTVSGTTVTITSAVANSETWGALVFGNPN